MERLVVWLGELSQRDRASVGRKAALLGELARRGAPVPPAFVIPAAQHAAAIAAAGLRGASGPRAAVEGRTPSPPPIPAVAAAARIAIPPSLQEAIADAYLRLGEGPVVVRTSCVAGAAATSFAGVHESVMAARSVESVVEAVLRCWRSPWSPLALAYRAAHAVTDEPIVAVLVERRVVPRCAGVLLPFDPTRPPSALGVGGAAAGGEAERMRVEATLGPGELVTHGAIVPEAYSFARDGALAVEAHVGTRPAASRGRPRPVEGAEGRVLAADELERLRRLSRRVDEQLGGPHALEWCIEDGRLHVLDARPVAAWRGSDETSRAPAVGRPLAVGFGSGSGQASGRARHLRTVDEAARLAPGEVLVVRDASPVWLPLLRRAAALVSDGGSAGCHLVALARELGVPCVVGTRDASERIVEGESLVVDAVTGRVHGGAPLAAEAPARATEGQPLTTRVHVNLSLPALAEEAAALPVDGVGLLRAEHLLADVLGRRHPRAVAARDGGALLVGRLADGLRAIALAFHPRPVLFRASDLRSDELRDWEGGAAVEPREPNPTLGYRGCYRHLCEPEQLLLELDAVARVREEAPNVHLLLPFVRTRWELEAFLELVDQHALGRQRGLRRWITAEAPSALFRLTEYAALGIDGVSIASSELTQLVLGVDRRSRLCANLFDEEDEAVLDAIHRLVEGCRAAGLESSLRGHAASRKPGYVERLVRWGVDAISIDPESAAATRATVAAVESRLRRERGTGG